MPRPLDPFEPWRPPPEPAREPIPPVPEVNPYQPWRPPGHEPARPQSPRAPEGHRPQPPRPPRQPAASPASARRWDQKLVLCLLPVFGLAWIIAYANLPAGHGLRLFTVLLPLALGTAAGITLLHGQRWSLRLAAGGLGLLLAGLAWWFMPTSDGPSLWGAHRLVSQVEDLPAGDVSAYTAGKLARQEAVARFPGLKADMDEAERTWIARTVDQAVEEADALLATDPKQASENLQALAGALERDGPGYSSVRDTLKAARRRALLARLEQGAGEMKRLLRAGEQDAARWKAVTDVGADLQEQLRSEAERLDVVDEVEKKLKGLRRQALERRLDAGESKLNALVKQGKLAEVPKQGARLAAELRDEAEQVAMRDELGQRMLAVRRRAFLLRLDGAEKELTDLIARCQLAAVADHGARHAAELGDEAKVVGREGELHSRLLAVRKRATQARLEAAKTEMRDLLQRDDYRAIAARNEQLFQDLRGEAKVVGLFDDLENLHNTWGFIADLARQASKAPQ